MFEKQVARRAEVNRYLLAHRGDALVEAYIHFHGPNQLGIPYAERGTDAGISYAERGTDADGSLPTLLLIHGYLDSWKSWSRVMEVLQHKGRIVALTLRGWGDSIKTGELTIASYAADVVAFMDAVGIHTAALAGHSMGTLVAEAVALAAPERVEGLVLAGAMATMDPTLDLGDGTTLGACGEHIDAWAGDGEGALNAKGKAWLEGFQLDDLAPFVKSGAVPQAFADQVMEETLKPPTTRPYKACWAEMLRQDHSAALARVKAPVCIVWGADDYVCPTQVQAALQKCLSGAEACDHRCIPGAGHGVIWTHAAETALIVDSFLASLR
tara:strand:+ start:594 stop:1571 length:978 start_codon:yes stop_codon:yes gene_type:complete